MKQGIGSVFLYNIIAVFIVLVFAFLIATMSYSKAFRINNRIIAAIEKYEGYNNPAAKEADTGLRTIGYTLGAKNNCPGKKGAKIVTNSNKNHKYCVYQFTYKKDKRYDIYGVQTYMDLEIPLVKIKLEIPVYSKTRKIYDFSK